jgi:hypothetical protein
LLQGLLERYEAGLTLSIVRGTVHEHADAPHPLGLLRARRERPRCRGAEQRDELAALPVEHRAPQAGANRLPHDSTSARHATAALGDLDPANERSG